MTTDDPKPPEGPVPAVVVAPPPIAPSEAVAAESRGEPIAPSAPPIAPSASPVAPSEAVAAESRGELKVPRAPTTATLDDLQAAAGITPKSPPLPSARRAPRPRTTAEEEEALADLEPRTTRRWPLLVAVTALVGATIAAFVLLGNANAQHYYLRCSAKQVVAERGRSFPPWGSERIAGESWRPIAIPPSAECTPRSTDDPVELEGWYLDAIVEQATAKLSGASPGDIDTAQLELEQAMLLTRSPERRDARKDLERLLGDVTYWRASAKVKAAITSLDDAAARFDEAVAKRPRHASDAGAWAEFARTTAAALGKGPGGAGVPMLPPSGVPLPGARPLAPPGTALPVEVPFIGTPDAGVPDTDAARSTLPAGGVLL